MGTMRIAKGRRFAQLQEWQLGHARRLPTTASASTMRIARGKHMSQEAKEEAKEKQRAKRVARLQDEKDADRK